MSIFETFADRKRKAEKAGTTEVYRYDSLPPKLRIQIGQIVDESLGGWHTYDAYDMGGHSENNETWIYIYKLLLKSMGRDDLISGARNPKLQIINFIRMERNVDDVLSAIEICCITLDRLVSKYNEYTRKSKGVEQTSDSALAEINYRFREAGVGYQYENGQIIRVDSQLAHSEIVKPALSLLSDRRFAGPEQEYLKAHQYFRAGEHKDAVIWANNAFESTLKVICELKGWNAPKGARASDLLKVVRANGLWPDYLDNSLDQLLSTLASGLPKVRNEEGGHGGGATPKQTPAYVAAYALHLAAAKILLISEAAAAKR